MSQLEAFPCRQMAVSEDGRGKVQAQMIPGWPYPMLAAQEPGRASWTAVLDAMRLGPDDDEAAVTAAQIRDVITGLAAAGHWRPSDPAILVIFDPGSAPPRPACRHRDTSCLRHTAPRAGSPDPVTSDIEDR